MDTGFFTSIVKCILTTNDYDIMGYYTFEPDDEVQDLNIVVYKPRDGFNNREVWIDSKQDEVFVLEDSGYTLEGVRITEKHRIKIETIRELATYLSPYDCFKPIENTFVSMIVNDPIKKSNEI